MVMIGEILVVVLLVLGGFFGFVGFYGLIKLFDLMMWLYVLIKVVMLGVGLVLIVLLIWFFL